MPRKRDGISGGVRSLPTVRVGSAQQVARRTTRYRNPSRLCTCRSSSVLSHHEVPLKGKTFESSARTPGCTERAATSAHQLPRVLTPSRFCGSDADSTAAFPARRPPALPVPALARPATSHLRHPPGFGSSSRHPTGDVPTWRLPPRPTVEPGRSCSNTILAGEHRRWGGAARSCIYFIVSRQYTPPIPAR